MKKVRNSGCGIIDQSKCPVVERVSELEHDLSELRKQNNSSHERVFDRIGELEKAEGIQGEQYKHIIEKLGSLTSSITELRSDNKDLVSKISPITNHVADVEQLQAQVDELRLKPAKRWEDTVMKIVALVVTAVVCFILGKIGL